MSKDGDWKLQMFDGRKYAMWKKRVIMLMKSKKCDAVATRDRSAIDTDAEAWETINLKAMNIIYGCITNEQWNIVNDEKTAFRVMKKFDKRYLKELTASQICIRNKLDRI